MSEVKRHSVTGYGRQDINYNDPEGEFVYYEDYAALQQKLDAMAAENAALRDVLEDIVEPQSSVLEREHRIRAENALKAQATDAYLNSVRADAVSNFWNKSLRDVAHVLNDIRAFDDSSEAAGIVHSEIKERVDDFVESLRFGTHDTADKGG